MTYTKIMDMIKRALNEDIGSKDITTAAIIPKDKSVKAVLCAKENFIVCGLDIASRVFKEGNSKIKFKPLVKDGQYVKKGRILARLRGEARSILTAERVALNFLGLLSGIATRTQEYVKKVKPYKVKIMDTRKTIPGLRDLEKYAVKVGGGYNHRFKLDEMVLIKDNHLKIINPKFKNLIKKIREKLPDRIKIEIEVKNLREFKEVLKLKPDIIMLDNMSIKNMKQAVQIRNRLSAKSAPQLEASGGITRKNIRQVAACGVEMISVGELTHSVSSVDISLEIQ